ncbi:MAG: low molecular weight phosphotyrosine protein phosphatase [Alphaproteobacteria bacterium]|nr:low molecular weight phosphotyrosine protein phosphatase [Alphaproteobacteria bacterium]
MNPENNGKIHILFVCTGNICRSPTAEGVFRHLVNRAGIKDRIAIDSAGVGAWHVGDPPDLRAQAAALRRGIDLSRIRARVLIPGDYTRFDYLVAMDRGHLCEIKRNRPPNASAKIELFMNFAPEIGVTDVPDPYYGDIDGFEHVLDLIEAGASGLLAAIRRINFGEG